MANNEHRTVLSVDAKVSGGFSRVPQIMDELQKRLKDQTAMQNIDKVFTQGAKVSDRFTVKIAKSGEAVVKLNRSFVDLRKSEAQLAKERERHDRVAAREREKKERTAERELKQVERKAAREKALQDRTEQHERKREDRIKARFGQGVLQGMSLPGLRSYIPGEGGARAQMRQMAGYAIGHTIGGIGRGLGGAFMGGAFGGLEGFQSGLSGLPWGIGGVLGGQFGVASGAYKDWLGHMNQSRQLINLNPEGAQFMAAMSARAGGFQDIRSGYAPFIQGMHNQLGVSSLAPKLGLDPETALQTVLGVTRRSGVGYDDNGFTNSLTQNAARTGLLMQSRGFDPALAGSMGRANRVGATNYSPMFGFRAAESLLKAVGGDLADMPELLERLVKVVEQNVQRGQQVSLGGFMAPMMVGASLGLNSIASQSFGEAFNARTNRIGDSGVKDETDLMMLSLFGNEGKGIPRNLNPESLLRISAGLRNAKSSTILAGLQRGTAMAGGDPFGLMTSLGRSLGLSGEMQIKMAEGLKAGGGPASLVDTKRNLLQGLYSEDNFAALRGDLTPFESARSAKTAAARLEGGYNVRTAMQDLEESQIQIFAQASETFSASLTEMTAKINEFSRVIAHIIEKYGPGSTPAPDYSNPFGPAPPMGVPP